MNKKIETDIPRDEVNFTQNNVEIDHCYSLRRIKTKIEPINVN